MPQTGYTPIQIYSSTTPTNAPSAGNLTNDTKGSELAINIADKNLFFKDSTNAVNTVPIRQSGAASDGWLSSTDWNTFNNKQPAGTYVTSVSGTAPVVSSGGTTPAISMAAATTSVNGYLTSTDWNTFNGKQAALVSGSNIKTVSGTTLLGSGDLGTIGVAYGGTGTSTAFTAGSVVFAGASGVYSQNNSALFWDNTNNWLGIGTTPSYALSVLGSTIDLNGASTYPTIRLRASSNTSSIFSISRGSSAEGAISTSSNLPITINTNGSERVRFFGGGGVSIGNTTDPGATNLSVNGNLFVGATSAYISGCSVIVNSTAQTGTGQLNLRHSSSTAGKYYTIGSTSDASPYFIVKNEGGTGVYIAPGGNSWTGTSDETQKTDLVPIEDAANKVSTLRAVTGRFIDDEVGKSRSFLIAQDVQKVLPEAVCTLPEGHLGLAYTDVIPLLVAAIKEQQTIIEQLKQKVGL